MTAATRRELLGGAVAGAALPLLGPAAATGAPSPIVPVKGRVVRRGRAIAAGGRHVVVAHDLERTIAIVTRGRRAHRIVDVEGEPLAVAVSPDGRHVAVATAAWDHPAVALVELATGHVAARRAVGPAPVALAFTPDGRRLLVAGGEQEGALDVLDARHLHRRAHVAVGRVPRGLAVAPDGTQAWVTAQADDHIVAVSLDRVRVRRELPTPALPDRLAVSPDGRRLLVTHGGRAVDFVTELDVRGGEQRRHAAGLRPSAVAYTSAGRRLVALGGEAAVIRLEGARRFATGVAPRGLAVAGRRFWTVSALTGAVTGGRA